MNTVKVKNIEIGSGVPKICVPIVGVTKDEIIAEAKTFDSIPVDVVEWRVDWFEGVFEFDKVEDVLKDLRETLGETPILFTFRTSKEGGEKAIEAEPYKELNIAAPNVRADPNTSPQRRLISPVPAIDIVMIGRSACSVYISSVAQRSVNTSRLQVGITAILGISAPSSCILQSLLTISSFSGVLSKSWFDATTFTPHSEQRKKHLHLDRQQSMT